MMGNNLSQEASDGQSPRQTRRSPPPLGHRDLGSRNHPSTFQHLGVEVTEGFLEEQMCIHRDIQDRQTQQGRARCEEQRWREAEAGRARQQEEARRKAEEVRARQRREQEMMDIGEMVKMLRERVARQKNEQEEARRKADEARAKREREELEARREQERKLREEEARRAGDEVERRKAEETRIRQEREEEGEISRLVERLRLDQTKIRHRKASLPQVCHRHNTRQGCSDPNCRRLHICRLFLADICKYGVNCRSGHSLTTVHNQIVCNEKNLETVDELALLQQLRRAFDEKDELHQTNYAKNLERCFKFGSRNPCDEQKCTRIHICREYVAGVCGRANCKFGHDLHTAHNNGVLSRHRLSEMTDNEIIEILREKKTARTQRIVCDDKNLETVDELAILQQLSSAFDEKDEPHQTMYAKKLERCFKFGSRNPCDVQECTRIHICREYVAGVCGRANCKFGHDLHTTHNNGVLSRHRLSEMTDNEIIEILREKEAARTQRTSGATAPASTARNGAVPRQRSAETTNQTTRQRSGQSGPEDQNVEKSPAGAGLSEELQCPVCLELFSRATTLGCGHSFCAACLQEVRDRSGDRCPLCRVTISSATRSVTLDSIVASLKARQ